MKTLKELVGPGQTVHFMFYRKGELWYKTNCGFEFPVPIEDTGDDDIYSNFYLRPFEHNGRTWQCSEQAFMASRAEMFGDYERHKLIVEMDPSTKQFAFLCKKLGRLVKNYDDALWSQVRQVKMFEILLSKFSDPVMMQQILATGDRMIVEASPFDKIWGIGFDENNALSAPFSKWGQNLLGQELMKVRTIFTRMQK